MAQGVFLLGCNSQIAEGILLLAFSGGFIRGYEESEMKDEDKTKGQLITELRRLRGRLTEAEKGKAEHEQAQLALQESRHMLQLVLDTIPVSVFWKNLDSKYLGCNRPFALDAGLHSPEEIIGKDDFEVGWS